jgi:hypothetical protein
VHVVAARVATVTSPCEDAHGGSALESFFAGAGDWRAVSIKLERERERERCLSVCPVGVFCDCSEGGASPYAPDRTVVVLTRLSVGMMSS